MLLTGQVFNCPFPFPRNRHQSPPATASASRLASAPAAFPINDAGTETLPGTEIETEETTREKVKDAFAKGWNVIVWNDPVNLMTYVVFVFMKVLRFPKEKATRHMLEVHQNGKSLVATENREKAELYHQQLQAHGLTVSIEQA